MLRRVRRSGSRVVRHYQPGKTGRERERDKARPAPLNTMARLWTQPQVPVALGSVGSDPVSASNVSFTLGSDRLVWFWFCHVSFTHRSSDGLGSSLLITSASHKEVSVSHKEVSVSHKEVSVSHTGVSIQGKDTDEVPQNKKRTLMKCLRIRKGHR